MNKEKDVLEEFVLNVGSMFGALNCVRIVCDIDGFKEWLTKEHKIIDFDQMFEGYKFFLESAVRTFLNSITLETSLYIEEDFVFHRARFKGITLNKVPNTCEKTIFVKHITKQLRKISSTSKYEPLKLAVTHFNDVVFDTFDKVFDKKVLVAKQLGISKDKALTYETMFQAYIFLTDTSRNIPHGYWVSVLNNSINKKLHKKSFKGYKYSLQFLWSRLLGERYHSTSLVNMHKSKRWAVHDNFFVSDDSETPAKREDLDNYFAIVGDEIIRPIQKQLGVHMGFNKILFVEEQIPSRLFAKLLTPLPEPQLTEKERLDYLLLWYDIEFLDTSSANIFNGVPAFVALLIGTAELVRRFSGGEDKALICKFTHPDKNVQGNDFSYGVLISAAGNIGDYSGWIFFFDCCGDHSGFAGSEHAKAEAIIDAYKKRGQIELNEMIIDKNKFRKLIVNRVVSRNRKYIESALERESRERRDRNIVAEARGLITELLTYYTLSKSGQGTVDWNIVKNGDQLDVILETTDKVTLIECVYDPANMDLINKVNKLKDKLQKINTNKVKSCVFWFWSRPQQKTIDKLIQDKIEFRVISDIIWTDPAWTEKKWDKLKTIFQFSQNSALP